MAVDLTTLDLSVDAHQRTLLLRLAEEWATDLSDLDLNSDVHQQSAVFRIADAAGVDLSSYVLSSDSAQRALFTVLAPLDAEPELVVEEGPWAGTAMTSNGAWTWFVDPRAIYYEGDNRRLYAGYVTSAGSVAVAQYDLDEQLLTRTTLHATLQVDDHDNPSLIVLPDGRIRAFYCKHAVNGDPLYTRVTTNPEDISSWGTETSITKNLVGTHGYSYPKPFRLSAEDDRIYLFFRSASFVHGCIYSDDDGATWSDAIPMFSNGEARPYFQAQSNGVDEIHFTCTDGHPRDEDNNLYHFYYRDGDLYESDGTLIGSLEDGATPAGVTKIYDFNTSGKAWGWDLVLDAGGRPRVAYAAFVSDSDHRYRYARWTGTEWQDAEVCEAGADIHTGLIGGMGDGEPNYSGGIAIDPTHPSYVYASTQTDTAEWDIHRYHTPDGGETWELDDTITAETSRKNVRPYVPRGLPEDGPKLLWLKGNGASNGGYTSYVSYDLSVMAGPELAIAVPPQPDPGTILGSDAFTGTNGDLVAARTPDVGTDWANGPAHGSSFFEIRTNRASPTTSSGALALLTPAEEAESYAVEAVLRIVTATGFGAVGGYMDDAEFTGYWARYNFTGTRWELFKTINNTSTALGDTVTDSFTAGNEVTVRLELRPGSQVVYVDDEEIISAADTAIASGLPAIRAGGGTATTGVHIASVEVTAL